MNRNRFENVNIDEILSNLEIRQEKDENIILNNQNDNEQQEEFINYESPKMTNQLRHKKQLVPNQESQYKISSKYKANSFKIINDSYSSLDQEYEQHPLELQQQQQDNYSNDYDDGSDVQNNIGNCTPPHKGCIINQNGSYDNEDIMYQPNDNNNINNKQNRKNSYNNQNNNNYNKFEDMDIKGTPPTQFMKQNNNNDQYFKSPLSQDNQVKFKINLEKFKLSATSSNKKISEEMRLQHQQQSNQKINQQPYQYSSSSIINSSSNRKNIGGVNSSSNIFDKLTPTTNKQQQQQQQSCSSIQNGLFSQTPKIFYNLKTSSTPSKNLVVGHNNHIPQTTNKKCHTNIQNQYSKNLFNSSQQQQHNYYSDSKKMQNNNNNYLKPPTYSKKLFQDGSDDDDNEQEIQFNNNNNIQFKNLCNNNNNYFNNSNSVKKQMNNMNSNSLNNPNNTSNAKNNTNNIYNNNSNNIILNSNINNLNNMSNSKEKNERIFQNNNNNSPFSSDKCFSPIQSQQQRQQQQQQQYDSNNIFTSPLNNQQNRKIITNLITASNQVGLFSITGQENKISNTKNYNISNENQNQELQQNNRILQLETIAKKGLMLQKDDQSTIKKNQPLLPTLFDTFISPQTIIPSSNQALNMQSNSNDNSNQNNNNNNYNNNNNNNQDNNNSNNNQMRELNQKDQHFIWNNINNNEINNNKQNNDNININNFFINDSNKNDSTNKFNILNFRNVDLDINQLNLPQVNEFSFETEGEKEQEEAQECSQFEDEMNEQRNNNHLKVNYNFNEGYDSDIFIKKKINEQPIMKWEESDIQSDNNNNSSQFIQNTTHDDIPDSNQLHLIKGKSVNLLSYENDLRNLNEANCWNLGLNRRNSEVGLDSNESSNKMQIDIGENEFTRAMPGMKQHQRPRIGSLVQNKKRAQTLLFQIPEGSDAKKSKQPCQLTQHQQQQFTHPFELEDDFDVQTPIRSKMIEQQDFQTLLKKASSQFIANNLTDRNYSRSSQFSQFSSMQHNKYDRFMKDFQIISVIKQTSHSSVYKCQSNVNGLIYAIKAISIPQDSQEQERIIKEVQSLVKFSSYGYGLLKFYNTWMEDNKLYLVTEDCLHNLRQMRNRNKASEQVIRQIIRDIAESLHFLHQNDYAHLGIKPENILASKKYKFKLADLGLSKIQLSENQESYFPYIAPELVGGNTILKQNIQSTKADIFSFGAVLYELMTDQDLPKYGPEWENLRSGRFHKLMNSVKYSASLKNLIKSMLLRNPKLRPSCQDILNQIPSDNALELELKYIVEENNSLEKKLEELIKKQENSYSSSSQQTSQSLKKKNSF